MNRLLEDIRAVTLDVGGTLIEPWPSVGHVYAEIAARFGINGIAPEALNRGFASAWRARRGFDYSRVAWRELVNQSFAGLSPEPPSQSCFEAIYEHFGTSAQWRVFEDVPPALAALKERGLKLAVVSNWDERLRPLLRGLRLDDYFNACVISHETGYTKPAPGIFMAASTALGVPPERILHVGDNDEEDVAGARAVGMKALHIVRGAAGDSAMVINDLRRLAGH